MVLFGPNPAPFPQTSLPFRLLGLFATIAKGKTGIREEQPFDTLICKEERYRIYVFSCHQNLAQGSLGLTERSCLFQWAPNQTLRVNLITLDISCLKSGQLKCRLSSWTPSIIAAAKMGTSGTILLICPEDDILSPLPWLQKESVLE